MGRVSEGIYVDDPTRPGYEMPPWQSTDRRALDIGCATGQTMALAPSSISMFGVDIDRRAVRHVRSGVGIVSCAEALPFDDRVFDFVYARVSLPYTYVRRSLAEAFRVLRHGGRFWATVHPLNMVLGHVRRSVVRGQWKDVIYRGGYVLLNGLFAYATGREIPWIGLTYQSFQTIRGMQRAMRRAGFDLVSVRPGARAIQCDGMRPAPPCR